jgi:hypothetical protein
MTDKELLQAAAKAAGIVLYERRSEDEAVPAGTHARLWDKPDMLTVLFWHDSRHHPMCRKNQPRGNIEWNPLTDDGDALRLAVKLRLDLSQMEMEGKHVLRVLGPASIDRTYEITEDDPYAATRCAIVRAAAALSELGAEHFGAEGK